MVRILGDWSPLLVVCGDKSKSTLVVARCEVRDLDFLPRSKDTDIQYRLRLSKQTDTSTNNISHGFRQTHRVKNVHST
jgi:hypothetical protein